jgi:hypothetical protein
MPVYPAYDVGVTAFRLANAKAWRRAATAINFTWLCCLTSLTCPPTSASRLSYEETNQYGWRYKKSGFQCYGQGADIPKR